MPLQSTLILSVLVIKLGAITMQFWSIDLFSALSLVLSLIALILFFITRKFLLGQISRLDQAHTDKSNSQPLLLEYPSLRYTLRVYDYCLIQTVLKDLVALHPDLRIVEPLTNDDLGLLQEIRKYLVQGAIDHIIERAEQIQYKRITLWPAFLEVISNADSSFIKEDVLERIDYAIQQTENQPPKVKDCVAIITLYRWLLNRLNDDNISLAHIWHRQGIAYGILATLSGLPHHENRTAADACYQIAECMHLSDALLTNLLSTTFNSSSDKSFPNPRATDWATTYYNRGNHYSDLSCIDKQASLKAAIACYDVALDIYDRKNSPLERALTLHNRANVYCIFSYGDQQPHLQQALDDYRLALRSYQQFLQRTSSPETIQLYRAATLNNIANVLCCYRQGNMQANLQQAIDFYREVGQIYAQNSYFSEYARACCNLATAYFTLNHEEGQGYLKQAIKYYEQGLEELEPSKYGYVKFENPRIFYNLGQAYRALQGEGRSNYLTSAISYYTIALNAYHIMNMPELVQNIKRELEEAQYELHELQKA